MPQLGEWVLGRSLSDIKHLNEITADNQHWQIFPVSVQYLLVWWIQVQRALASAIFFTLL